MAVLVSPFASRSARVISGAGLVAGLGLAACTAGAPRDENLPASKREAERRAAGGKADWGAFDVCELKGWYEDGVCDDFWFCDVDPDCLHPVPEEPAAAHPIVLVHGFDGSPTNRWGFYGVAEALEEAGNDVYVATVPPYDTPEVRAAHLEEQVAQALDRLGADRANIVAHSTGGLDARVLASPSGRGRADLVASVTTIASPHRGAPVADFALSAIDGLGVPEEPLNALAETWGLRFNDLAEGTDLYDALEALSESRGAASYTAERLPDADSVYYQSWAGVSTPFGIATDGYMDRVREACEGELFMFEDRVDRVNWQLLLQWAVTSDFDFPHDELQLGSAREILATARRLVPAIEASLASLAPNDGMSSVQSAKWGEFRGCIPADHLDEVGQIERDAFNADTGFDHRRFYLGVVEDLADRGL